MFCAPNFPDEDNNMHNKNTNVKVVVRIRPHNELELSEKYSNVTEAISDHMLVFDPKIQDAHGFLQSKKRDISRRRYRDLKYAFDYVFGPVASNRDVFECTTKGVVSGVLNGYNCSVFAYGATGAGKTHTMLGNEREPGVIYHTMIDLYQRINQQQEEKTFDVAVSYLEVYNEQVRDLLMPRGSLPIREDKTVGVIIAGLSLHKPKNADELLHMLHFGNKNRTQHPTDANAESSRSHAVFQVFLNQREKSASAIAEVKMAKMCLVDLAGSERACHTKNCGIRFREGANINRSLLALGNVINALADNKFKGHIPYRDSKLTRLLKDSLGGNCQTVMIATVSPSSRSFEDTYNTLRYADRAKHIRADLKRNVMSVDVHIANYKKHVQELEKENQELRLAKQKLMMSLELKEATETKTVSPNVRQIKERLSDLFRTRKEIRKSQMASEGAKRELKWKVSRKEHAIRRIQMLNGSMQTIGKHHRIIERMKRRIQKEEHNLLNMNRELLEHEKSIYSLCSEVSSLSCNHDTPEWLDLNIRTHMSDASMFDSHMYLAFVKKMARAQEVQSTSNERLIQNLIQLVKKQHNQLLAVDKLTPELTTDHEHVIYLVEERGVAWAHGTKGSPGYGNNQEKYCDQEDDFCISDIIDMQFPKLNIGVMKSMETAHGGAEGDHVSNVHQPQRVMRKPGKLAMRVPGHVVHPSSSGDQKTEEPVPARVPTAKDSDISQVAENIAPSMNPVEVLNVSLEMCPKRHRPHSRKNPNAPHSTCVSGLSFAGEKIQEDQRMHNTFASSREQAAKSPKAKQSSAPDAQRSLNKTVLESPERAKSVAEFADADSSGNTLNDTFQVAKPALPNTPCIDAPQRLSRSSKNHPKHRSSTPQMTDSYIVKSPALLLNTTTSCSSPKAKQSSTLQPQRSLNRLPLLSPEGARYSAQLDVEDADSSINTLNDTFQVAKPALPNTPCIDRPQSSLSKNSSKHRSLTSLSNDSHLLSTATVPNTPCGDWVKKTAWKNSRPMSPLSASSPILHSDAVIKKTKPHAQVDKSKLHFLDTKDEGHIVSKYKDLFENVIDKDFHELKHNHVDDGHQQRQLMENLSPLANKSKSTFTQVSSLKSPTCLLNTNERQVAAYGLLSPSSTKQASSAVRMRSTPTSVYSSDKQRPASVCCTNFNNKNNFPSDSPKSYADAVKSPLPCELRSPVLFQRTSSPLERNGSGEPLQGMTTPIQQSSGLRHRLSVAESLKKHGIPSMVEAFSIDRSRNPDSDGGRQPLKLLDGNTPTLRSPGKSQRCVESDGGARTQKQMELINSLKKHGIPSMVEAFSIVKSTNDGVRRPLKLFDGNVPTLKSPGRNSNSSTETLSNISADNHATSGTEIVNKSSLKIRSGQSKVHRRQRALTTNPYVKDPVRNLKKYGSQSTLQLTNDCNLETQATENRPSYMRPTLATAARMFGHGKGHLSKGETAALSRHTVTHTQPSLFTWGKLTNGLGSRKQALLG